MKKIKVLTMAMSVLMVGALFVGCGKSNLNVVHFEDSPSMFLAVQGGNADFALEDYPVIAYKIKVDANNELKIAGEKVTTANYGFAVNKGKNSELLGGRSLLLCRK